MRCLVESCALKEEREGNDGGSLAAAGFAYGGAQATLRAASGLLYLQYETIGGRQASRARMEGVWSRSYWSSISGPCARSGPCL